MRILLIHQNFPGQFLRLAPALAARGHHVAGLTVETNKRTATVPVVRYRAPPARDKSGLGLAATFAQHCDQGLIVARAAHQLRTQQNYVPDVVFGHIGWGETLFVKQVWPEARVLLYAEFFYRSRGLDTGFDPEWQSPDLDADLRVTARQAPLIQSVIGADKWVAPTRWQANSFPEMVRDRIAVIHDGIDTELLQPSDDASVELPGTSRRLTRQDEVLTFLNRNLEPYRGYHTFMRALPAVMAARPKAEVVIVGADGVSYGGKAPDGKTWKSFYLDEVKDRLDMSRVHMVGQVPYPTFVDLMRVTRAHAYLTYPFVLSWSMLEAMSAGALVIGSSTPPVTEVIEDGVNGRLVDFFDIEGWSKALIEALAEPQRFDAMRQAARRTIIERYDLKTVCLPRMIDFVETP